MRYQLTRDGMIILRHNEDGSISHIPTVEKNEDYQAYLAWVDAGGVAEQYEGWVDPEAPLVPDEIVENP
jgi:hypothetical protein